MASISWTVAARDDLREVVEYIQIDSPAHAAATAERILHAVDRLSDFPKLGRVVPEYDNEAVREVIVGSYRVMYLLHQQQVDIFALIQGSQDVLNRTGHEPWSFD